MTPVSQMSAGTTPQMDLNELAAKVEALSGPDRGIDALITIAMDPKRQTIVGHKPGRFPREPIYGPITEFVEMAEENGKDAADYLNAPAYTASIDAAMTLVPTDARLIVDSDGCHCRITKRDDAAWHWNGFAALASTMALAITAAALRARAQAASQ